MVLQEEINIQESSASQKSNYAMPVRLCNGATFVRKKYYLVVSVFYSHTYPKILILIAVTLSHIIDIFMAPSN